MKIRLKEAMVTALALFMLTGKASAAGEAKLVLVPEMERPPGIVYQRAALRNELGRLPESNVGLEALRRYVEEIWPEITRVDLIVLSKHHVDQMKGFELPARPAELEGQVIGRDEGTGALYLELRGPRLPARYEIVHRYLYFYSSYEPATGELGPLVVTIRGWVLE